MVVCEGVFEGGVVVMNIIRKISAGALAALVFTVQPARGDEISYQVQKTPYAKYLDPGKLTVVASFDGGKALDRWQNILDFADKNGVKFTFFISGVYFLPDDEKSAYLYPLDPAKKGVSDIGFGGTPQDVAARKQFVLTAIKKGHDIQTHLNGHFDGTRWPEEAWRREFKEFNALVNFVSEPVRHVRFPLLAMSPKVFPVLAEQGIRSITSVVESDYENFNRITVPAAGGHYSFYLFSNWNHAAYWDAMEQVIQTLRKNYDVEFLTVSALCDRLEK
jgi:peptidoglycan/xylan/chitin deacetylase (PgdA/CDA1 family)